MFACSSRLLVILSSLGNKVSFWVHVPERAERSIGSTVMQATLHISGIQTLARLARIDPELLYPVKHRSVKAQGDLTLIRARA